MIKASHFRSGPTITDDDTSPVLLHGPLVQLALPQSLDAGVVGRQTMLGGILTW